jgi:ferric-dicitrate binding protein FerR (iron transport regulator)
MARSDDGIQRRPERVIILDAEDPMTEIEGRFVWQEEHDRVVEEVRRLAFADGYSAGQRDAQAQAAPAQLELRRRRGIYPTIKIAILALAVICVLLALPVIVFGS